MACTQTIGFIFPIHWSELSTSLKATLRVSDLSFGSLSELSTSLKATLRMSDLSFGSLFKNGIRLILSDTVFLSLSLKILQMELPTPFPLIQKVYHLLQGQLLLQRDLI